MRLVVVGIVAMLLVTLVGIGGAAAPDILTVAERNVVKLGEPAPNFRSPLAIGMRPIRTKSIYLFSFTLLVGAHCLTPFNKAQDLCQLP